VKKSILIVLLISTFLALTLPANVIAADVGVRIVSIDPPENSSLKGDTDVSFKGTVEYNLVAGAKIRIEAYYWNGNRYVLFARWEKEVPKNTGTLDFDFSIFIPSSAGDMKIEKIYLYACFGEFSLNNMQEGTSRLVYSVVEAESETERTKTDEYYIKIVKVTTEPSVINIGDNVTFWVEIEYNFPPLEYVDSWDINILIIYCEQRGAQIGFDKQKGVELPPEDLSGTIILKAYTHPLTLVPAGTFSIKIYVSARPYPRAGVGYEDTESLYIAQATEHVYRLRIISVDYPLTVEPSEDFTIMVGFEYEFSDVTQVLIKIFDIDSETDLDTDPMGYFELEGKDAGFITFKVVAPSTEGFMYLIAKGCYMADGNLICDEEGWSESFYIEVKSQRMPGQIAILEHVLCRGIDKNGDPVDATSVFTTEEAVYSWVSMANTSKGDKIIWAFKGPNETVETFAYEVKSDGEDRCYAKLDLNVYDSANIVGSWTVTVYVNGKTALSQHFTVKAIEEGGFLTTLVLLGFIIVSIPAAVVVIKKRAGVKSPPLKRAPKPTRAVRQKTVLESTQEFFAGKTPAGKFFNDLLTGLGAGSIPGGGGLLDIKPFRIAQRWMTKAGRKLWIKNYGKVEESIRKALDSSLKFNDALRKYRELGRKARVDIGGKVHHPKGYAKAVKNLNKTKKAYETAKSKAKKMIARLGQFKKIGEWGRSIFNGIGNGLTIGGGMLDTLQNMTPTYNPKVGYVEGDNFINAALKGTLTTLETAYMYKIPQVAAFEIANDLLLDNSRAAEIVSPVNTIKGVTRYLYDKALDIWNGTDIAAKRRVAGVYGENVKNIIYAGKEIYEYARDPALIKEVMDNKGLSAGLKGETDNLGELMDGIHQSIDEVFKTSKDPGLVVKGLKTVLHGWTNLTEFGARTATSAYQGVKGFFTRIF